MAASARRFIDDEEEGEFALSVQQLASARDPHFSFRQLADPAPAAAPAAHVGRPWFVWRHDLELARKLNDRLAIGAAD